MSSEKVSEKSFWKVYRFPIVLLGSIILGSIIGLIFGKGAMVLQPLGDIFLRLMFTIVVPLVFVVIAGAVGNMMNMRRLGKILGSMIGTFVATGIIAGIIMITVVTIFPPAKGANIPMGSAEGFAPVSLTSAIVSALTVGDFKDLLSRSNMMPLILFSILFGFCVSSFGEGDNLVAKWLTAMSKVIMKMVDIIMLYAPIGLGAYFASLVGEFGPQLLGAYGRAMAVYYPICLLYFVIAFPLYSLFAGGKPAVQRMWKFILPPALTSIATQSSVATLPVNLEAAGKIGVPKDIREIVLPIGATMHMDGTVLSSLLKISFLFGIFGQNFAGIDTFVMAMAVSILGGVVMSGVPGGGLIGEMLIVSLFGFPPEAFPLIATIGFLVDPPATCINATGDTIASMVVTRFIDGKDWAQKLVNQEKAQA
ncbi:sodium:dicarboxylate symporter [Spirochaetia bacterium]|nr:sodium:dicarboxylate symporter [Spirochaetia bacterium]